MMHTNSGTGLVIVFTPNGKEIKVHGDIALTNERVDVVTEEGVAFSYPAPWCIITWGSKKLPESDWLSVKVMNLLACGKKLEAIKTLKAEKVCTLVEAKAEIERFLNLNDWKINE